ncbi:MAG: oligosaccharide flippase family protein [Anaerolineae bacterium]|nr:oligosaccharide flippase family protein [Anaerolineae bacterium]
MLQKLTGLSKQSITYGLGTFLNQGISFLLLPIYAQFLSREDYGINGSVSALISILSIVMTFSLEGAVTRFYYDMKSEQAQRAYFGRVWILILSFGLAIALVLELGGDQLFALLFPEIPFDPYGRLATWGSYLAVFSALPNVIWRVREQARVFVAFSVSQFLLRVLLNIVFVVFLQQGSAGIFRSFLLANLVYAIPYAWVTLKNSSFVPRALPLGESIAFALPLIPHRLSNWVLNVSDRILLQNYVPLGDIGLYSMGYRVGMTLAAVLDAINLAWTPFYFKTAQEDDGRQSLARLVTYYVFALLFLTLGVVLLSRELILLVAAPRFYPAAQIVPPIAFAYSLHGIYLTMVAALSYVKQTKWIMVTTMISAIVNVALNLLFIPRYGIWAAAWSTFASFFVRTLLVSALSLRLFPIPYEYKRLAYAVGLALLLSTGWFLDIGNWWANVGIKILLLVAYPIGIRFSGILHAEEVSGLRVIRHKVQARLAQSLGRLP